MTKTTLEGERSWLERQSAGVLIESCDWSVIPPGMKLLYESEKQRQGQWYWLYIFKKKTENRDEQEEEERQPFACWGVGGGGGINDQSLTQIVGTVKECWLWLLREHGTTLNDTILLLEGGTRCAVHIWFYNKSSAPCGPFSFVAPQVVLHQAAGEYGHIQRTDENNDHKENAHEEPPWDRSATVANQGWSRTRCYDEKHDKHRGWTAAQKTKNRYTTMRWLWLLGCVTISVDVSVTCSFLCSHKRGLFLGPKLRVTERQRQTDSGHLHSTLTG